MDRPWRIEMLGGLRATQGEQVVSRFRTQKTGALLAYLAYYCRRSHSRGELTEQHWPEADPDTGRHNLSMALSSLRRQLEPPGVPPGAVIVADRAAVHLNPAACVTDVLEFEATLRATARAGTVIERTQRLEAAVELYRGELLPGYFEEWIVPERERLAEAFLQAIGQLIVLLEQEGDLSGALQWARRGVSAEPLREEAHQDLMRLLAAAGQPEAALRQYRELERLLEMAYAVEPAPDIRALAEAIGEGTAGGRVQPVNRGAPPPSLTSSPPHAPSPPPIPAGTVTFLLIEIPVSAGPGEREARPEGGGSPEGAVAARESCLELLRPLFRDYGGHEVGGRGEILSVTFGRASDALAAAVAAHQAVSGVQGGSPDRIRSTRSAGTRFGPGDRPRASRPRPEDLKVRMALHTGEVGSEEKVEHGPAFHHAVRLLLAAHPGQILLSEKSAVLLRDARDFGVHLVDLGLYRLRDPGEPERLFQARSSGMAGAELARPSAPPAHPGNLPLQFNRFFGREEEIARLREMLGPLTTQRAVSGEQCAVSHPPPTAHCPLPSDVSPCRLVTLTGPAGCGKTRLALEAAQRLREWWRGAVWFVSLADLAEPHRIATAIRDALRLPRTPHGEALEQIVSFLSNQPSLLLLDNFEHLVHEGAATVRTLLERVETLTVLVTSRQRLSLSGEQELPVASLPVPVDGSWLMVDGLAKKGWSDLSTINHLLSTLTACPSVQLFVDRAQAARADFQVTAGNAAAVAELCRRLEGLPLAIELVAARAQVLAPAQMLARLSERFELLVSRRHDDLPRHRSLRAALDWSYLLLPPELQHFFPRLSLFRGGWTLEAAEAVCGGEGLQAFRRSGVQEGQPDRVPAKRVEPARTPEHLTLDCLEALRECSLVVAEVGESETRYRLLETLREYGAEQLAPEERAALARRHAEYYTSLTEQAEACWLRSDQKQWLERMDAEHDNLRAVLAWSEGESGRVEIGLRLGGALQWFWASRGYLREGRERLLQLLARAGEARTPERAKALARAGAITLALGAMEEARSLLTEALAMARECNQRSEIAFSLHFLGHLALFRGDYAEAGVLLEQSRAISEEMGNPWEAAGCLNLLGHVARYQGDYARARSLFEETLARQRVLGDRHGIAIVLKNLSIIARYQEDYESARSLAEESLEIQRALGDRGGIALALLGLGGVLEAQGDLGAARARCEESLEIRREMGIPYGIAWSLGLLGRVAFAQGDAAKARSLYRESLAMRRELADRRGIAECLEGLAAVARAAGQLLPSARLFGAAQALRDAIGSMAPPRERREQQQQLAALREALGEAGFLAPWNAGRALSWEQAVAEAMLEC